MAVSVQQPFVHVEDANGIPYSGARLHVYAAGTTTPLLLYSDAAATSALTNPLIADSAGNFPRAYLASPVSYKLRAETSASVLLWEHDDIDPGTPVGSGAVPISSGGTGATTAPNARSNLGAASALEVANMAVTLAGQAGTVSSVETRTTALETTVNTAVTGNTARITAVEGRAGALETTVNTPTTGNTARITALETDVTSLENTRVRFDTSQGLTSTQQAQARANAPPFATGTIMLFRNSTAPTGWTKDTTFSDHTIRLTSGATSAGGTVGFSTLFSRTTTDAHTLTQAELPNVSFTVSIPAGQGSHGHPSSTVAITGGSQDAAGGGQNPMIAGGSTPLAIADNTLPAMSGTAASGGSGTAFTMPIDMRVNYVDFINAVKD